LAGDIQKIRPSVVLHIKSFSFSARKVFRASGRADSILKALLTMQQFSSLASFAPTTTEEMSLWFLVTNVIAVGRVGVMMKAIQWEELY
jgi:hypothetical protein